MAPWLAASRTATERPSSTISPPPAPRLGSLELRAVRGGALQPCQHFVFSAVTRLATGTTPHGRSRTVPGAARCDLARTAAPSDCSRAAVIMLRKSFLGRKRPMGYHQPTWRNLRHWRRRGAERQVASGGAVAWTTSCARPLTPASSRTSSILVCATPSSSELRKRRRLHFQSTSALEVADSTGGYQRSRQSANHLHRWLQERRRSADHLRRREHHRPASSPSRRVGGALYFIRWSRRRPGTDENGTAIRRSFFMTRPAATSRRTQRANGARSVRRGSGAHQLARRAALGFGG